MAQPKKFLPPMVAEYQQQIYEAVTLAAWKFRAARSGQEMLAAQIDLTIAVGHLTHFTALAAGITPVEQAKGAAA